MPNEASKTRNLLGDRLLSLVTGSGIDIGCGPDPIHPDVDRFDKEQGDANHITQHVAKRYDYVFASHVLEHMEEPSHALHEWFTLLKPGGHLVVIVPDEDLYEQGVFPSVFNDDHKHTFTISKARSWSAKSVNVLDLARAVGGDLVRLELHDHGYDRRLLRHSPARWRLILLTYWRRIVRHRALRCWQRLIDRFFIAAGALVDQTAYPDARLAQIFFVIRKPIEVAEPAPSTR